MGGSAWPPGTGGVRDPRESFLVQPLVCHGSLKDATRAARTNRTTRSAPSLRATAAVTSIVTARRVFAIIACVALVISSCARAGTAPAQPPASIQTPDGTGGSNHTQIIDRNYVVLISFDGLRHDYLDRLDTPAFDRLASTGAVADALIPVFPTLTFPSHYSIATGMYPASHGIVGNQFYDPARDDDFNYRDTDDAQDGSWWGGEPIWLTAEQQGMAAAALFFPGTEAAIGGLRPSRWRAYDGGLPNRARVEQVLQWLRLPPDERPHLITLYFSMVDGAGHSLGPDAPELERSLRTADRLLSELLSEIERLPYGERVYVVAVSDHGMARVDPDRQILLRDAVDIRGVRAVPLGPGLSLHVDGDEARSAEIRDTFNSRVDERDARAFLRDETPPRLHIANHPRYGDVILLPAEGVRVAFRRDPSPPAGQHGWDPTLPSMHGVFLVRGPGIAGGQRIPAFEAIHIYPFLAEILGLTPNPEIDGDLQVLEGILAGSRANVE